MMSPQLKSSDQDGEQQSGPQDEYVRQVEDNSRPAQEVLRDQHEGHALDESPALFVP